MKGFDWEILQITASDWAASPKSMSRCPSFDRSQSCLLKFNELHFVLRVDLSTKRRGADKTVQGMTL